jgi:hypothetical protein
MRLLSKIAISGFILSGMILFSYKPKTFPVDITGHLRKNPNDTSANIKRVIIIAKGDNKILAKTKTSLKGNFHITFTPTTEKSFDFFCTAIGIDTVLIASMKGFDSDVMEMTFYLPIKYKKNSLGKIICPKCNQTDKVYEVEYGEPTFVSHINKKGDTTNSRIYNGKYHAGTCVGAIAKYYCDRNKIKF